MWKMWKDVDDTTQEKQKMVYHGRPKTTRGTITGC